VLEDAGRVIPFTAGGLDTFWSAPSASRASRVGLVCGCQSRTRSEPSRPGPCIAGMRPYLWEQFVTFPFLPSPRASCTGLRS
jgi:hypothetical protein